MIVTGAALIEWVRPHVLEAGDGILTSAGIVEGLAGAGVASNVIAFTAAAGLIAGGLAMGVTEYAKAAAERDRQLATLSDEQIQIEASPGAELDELTEIYISRGLSPPLARQVAVELMAHDPLQAHAEAEHHITALTAPLRVALAAGISFAAGAALLFVAVLVVPTSSRVVGTFGVVLVALALTGWVSAKISDVHPLRPIARTAGTGALAMIVTYVAGRVFHP